MISRFYIEWNCSWKEKKFLNWNSIFSYPWKVTHGHGPRDGQNFQGGPSVFGCFNPNCGGRRRQLYRDQDENAS